MAASNGATSDNSAEGSATREGAEAGTEAVANPIIVESTAAHASIEQTEQAQAEVAREQGASTAASKSIAGPLPSDAEMLQLAEVLQGEHEGNLDALLTFTSDGTNTTIHVSAGGDRATQEQEIVLHGVGDLTAGGARSASVIIGDLLMQGTLGTDSM